MAARRIKPERVRMAEACAITGKASRAIQDMAATGKIPGAAKIGGEWTFNELTLRRWVERLESTPCQEPDGGRPRLIRFGGGASCGAGSRSAARTASGRYEQTMRKLLGAG